MSNLKNMTAIVTGAGSGIGRQIALMLARDGAFVIVHGLFAEGVKETQQLIKKQYGADSACVIGDIGDQEVVNNLIQTTIQERDTIDILVNNAGVMDNMCPVGFVSDDDWNHIIEINLTACMRAMRAAIPFMLRQQHGSIINISSVAGTGGGKGGASYTASKWALIGLSKNTAIMYGNDGIRCNVLCPGSVPTTNLADGLTWDTFGSQKIQLCSELIFRGGEAAEIAKVAAFLAGEDAAFLNGAVVTADGGWSAW